MQCLESSQLLETEGRPLDEPRKSLSFGGHRASGFIARRLPRERRSRVIAPPTVLQRIGRCRTRGRPSTHALVGHRPFDGE